MDRTPLVPLRGGPFHERFARSRGGRCPQGGVPGGFRGGGRRYYLLPTNFAFGTWVARLIAAPLNQRATKASALPKNQRFSGAPRFFLPIRAQFQERFARSRGFQRGGTEILSPANEQYAPHSSAVPGALRAFQASQGSVPDAPRGVPSALRAFQGVSKR